MHFGAFQFFLWAIEMMISWIVMVMGTWKAIKCLFQWNCCIWKSNDKCQIHNLLNQVSGNQNIQTAENRQSNELSRCIVQCSQTELWFLGCYLFFCWIFNTFKRYDKRFDVMDLFWFPFLFQFLRLFLWTFLHFFCRFHLFVILSLFCLFNLCGFFNKNNHISSTRINNVWPIAYVYAAMAAFSVFFFLSQLQFLKAYQFELCNRKTYSAAWPMHIECNGSSNVDIKLNIPSASILTKATNGKQWILQE